MDVIGRFDEISRMKTALDSSKSELIAVYGRRRVGKTFLIREYYKEHIIFDLTGLYKGTNKEQLKNFHKALKEKYNPNDRLAMPVDWGDALDMLKDYIGGLKSKKKKVIFIDEFPWIATARTKFLMWFEHFWNSYCTKRTDLVVVICGSSASYMVKKIINNKGGLHNRISHKIRLEPFTLFETELFLKKKNIHFERYDLVQLYMAIGGVPHYLEKVQRGQSVAQNIDRMCFDKTGELVNEFHEVFASLFIDSRTHIEMIRAFATSNNGITRSDLLEKCNLQQNGYTTEVLNELIESGFVAQYTPFGKKDRNSLFRLSDEFCLFYLKFMEPHKNQGAGTWLKLASKQSFKIWSGFAFETICLKHIQEIKNALGIGKVYTLHSSWRNENAQIDLVIDRDDNRINLCEMKFHEGRYTIDNNDLENLRNKQFNFKSTTKTKKGVYYTLISSFGVVENAQSLSILENSLTMDCLFEKK